MKDDFEKEISKIGNEMEEFKFEFYNAEVKQRKVQM